MEPSQTETRAQQGNGDETRQALERGAELVEELIDYAATTFGDEALAQAWLDFNDDYDADDPKARDDDDPNNDIFLPWFVFNWMPDEQHTLAELYAAAKGDELADADRALFASMGRRQLSFFEIKAIAPDGWVELHDLLLGVDASVFDEGIAEEGAVGDVMFGTVRPGCGKVGNTFGSAPYFLDHEMVDEVEKLRVEILKASDTDTVSAAALESYQADIIGFFLDSFGDGEDEGSADA